MAAVFFDGLCSSRTARTGYASCISPGVSTPVWFDGENRTGLQDPEAVQRGALKGESYDPVADNGIEFPNLSIGVAGARYKGRS